VVDPSVESHAIVIASNTGPSQIIDRYGRVVASAPDIFITGVASGSIYPSAGGTVYTAVGDVFVLGVFTLLGMFFGGTDHDRTVDQRETTVRLAAGKPDKH
jgi:apolipoprotein N-acyltransferase